MDNAHPKRPRSSLPGDYATYHARITVRNGDRLTAPTVAEIEKAVSKGVSDLIGKPGVIVNVDATRTDI